jgi:putative polyketide hydroxylase
MSSTDSHFPVVIIGGGIVGLSASLFLAHQGIHSLLVERHSGTSIHPRARSVNARTMEIYRGIGLSSAVREAGASLSPSKGIYSGPSVQEVIFPKRREEKRPFPLAGLFSETGPESGAFVTLDMIEPVLFQAAKDRGVDTRFSTDCLGVEQDDQKVTVTLNNRSSNKIYKVTADYLIAADGANSPIRESLGIQRTGKGELGNLLNILFHTKPSLESFVKNREFSILKIERPEFCGMLTSINNKERWVFHLHYDPSKGQKPEDFPEQECKRIISIALGMPNMEIDVKSILPWQASVRVAERIQEGRIFLAGDAAHQMPPYRGQGANSGISDAHNLAWKLAAVLKKQASPALLETYERERLPVGKYAAEKSGEAADDRGLIMWKKDLKTIVNLAGSLHIMSGYGYTYSGKAVIEEHTGPLGGITWRPWSMPSFFLGLDGTPGTRAPHLWLEKGGKRISTTDLFGKGFLLLAGADGEAWAVAAGKVLESMKAIELKAECVGPHGGVRGKEREWETAAGISSTGALLVRPDGFVAWRERRVPDDVDKQLEEVMKQMLCV